jgi:hypothetical protein
MKRRLAYISATLAVLFFLAGVGSMMWSYRVTQTWENVNARVLSNEVIRFNTSSGVRHRGEFEIGFLVHDQRYRVPLSLPDHFKTFEQATDDLRRYAINSTQRVYYNPADPRDVLLDMNTARFYAIPLGLAGMGILLLALTGYLFWRLGKRLCPKCAMSADQDHVFCAACGYPLPAKRVIFREL